MEEIILIDKPKGISSFDVIRKLRKELKIKKMGHAGTLDPLASGLLIIGIGKGTKKLNNFLKLPKTYLMEIMLGRQTESGDLEGKTIKKIEVKKINKKELKKILKKLEGEIILPVPIYSAVKKKGVPLYKLARKGIKVTPPKRKMKIYSLKLKKTAKKEKFIHLFIEMECGAGTYARSVAEEIGRQLGLPACLANLRRTKIGNFIISKARKI